MTCRHYPDPDGLLRLLDSKSSSPSSAIRKLPPGLAVEQRLVVAGHLGQEGLVEIRRPFWGDALTMEGHPKTVPAALVYADLLATGDARCIETAQMVYDQFLARFFETA